jgi:NTP pyrophosphatase (non-canonical NTP hydrolase)
MTRDDAYALIDAERTRQAEKWTPPHDWGRGDCSSWEVEPTTKAAVLAEECGEVARAVLDNRPDDLRTELVQVAAVAVAWLESL